MLKFDMQSETFIQNPYPIYNDLLNYEPVYKYESELSSGWIISKYEDVVACLRHPTLSSGEGRGLTTLKKIPAKELAPFTEFIEFYKKWLLLTDPPDHTRLRKLANRGFTPGHVERLRPYMQGLIDGLLTSVVFNPKIEFMREFCYILPAMTILEMLGSPQKDRAALVGWSNDIAQLIGASEITPEILKPLSESYHKITDYFAEHITDLLDNPRQNVLSALIHENLTGDELYAQAVVLLIGGHETTRNLIGNGVLRLLQHPEAFEDLWNNPAIVELAIEEFLRFDAPVQYVGRTCMEPMEIRGKKIKKGDYLMLNLGAANRDPDVFENPNQFKIRRKPNKHLSFGLGRHFCLGAPLARVQVKLVFERLINRFEKIELLEESIRWANSPVFRGPNTLNLSFTPRGS